MLWVCSYSAGPSVQGFDEEIFKLRPNENAEFHAGELGIKKAVRIRQADRASILVVVLGAFSWAKEFLLPIILAILISFLLAPGERCSASGLRNLVSGDFAIANAGRGTG